MLNDLRFGLVISIDEIINLVNVIMAVTVTLILTFILIIKPIRCTNFLNLFWNKTLHVSDSSSVHHQELFTVNRAMVFVIQFC